MTLINLIPIFFSSCCLGEELIPTVLDHLKVNLVVGIGEGAGANVLVRFALTNQSRVLGKQIFIDSKKREKFSLIGKYYDTKYDKRN